MIDLAACPAYGGRNRTGILGNQPTYVRALNAANDGFRDEPCWRTKRGHVSKVCMEPAKAAGLCPDHLEEMKAWSDG